MFSGKGWNENEVQELIQQSKEQKEKEDGKLLNCKVLLHKKLFMHSSLQVEKSPNLWNLQSAPDHHHLLPTAHRHFLTAFRDHFKAEN
ncbi:CLUMA_CG015643, isoform A [Clunio marinus]|uniref:CLUMA_CG015643, isoform A n=1 Tax=Clunio marinus TaxID=568069 RepID=A0A1J1ISP5_9DIPT|nr:CLUMA_CG015643, isoform A [Clunio marinus]